MFKNYYVNSVLLWIVLIVLGLLTANIYIMATTMVYTGMLPFINIVLWFSISELGCKLRKHLKTWHWAVIASWLIFLYSLYAQKWTAGVLNDVFHVDPSHFTITYSLLAFWFTPVGIFYQDSVVGSVFAIFMVTALVFITFLPFVLLSKLPMKKILKVTVLFFLTIFLVSFLLQTASNISNRVGDIALNFALWADFNESHLCSDEWVKQSQRVIFLGGDKVLVHDPSSEVGRQFKVESCNMRKVF
ncbi:TPA: hypothetical protein ACGUWK_004373 [Vibrio vulnificus]|nr:hypothetical protein [Vibrio vulnificus]